MPEELYEPAVRYLVTIMALRGWSMAQVSEMTAEELLSDLDGGWLASNDYKPGEAILATVEAWWFDRLPKNCRKLLPSAEECLIVST